MLCVHTGYFHHLRVCMEPDWLAPGSRGDTVFSGISRLDEWLQRREQPNALQRHEAVCLARGLDAALTAVERAGGALTIVETHPGLTFRLCHGLMYAVGDPRRRWLPGNACCRVEHAFAELGPIFLWIAPMERSSGCPGFSQRACAAAQLTHAYLRMRKPIQHPNEQIKSQRDLTVAAVKQVRLPHIALLLLLQQCMLQAAAVTHAPLCRDGTGLP